MSEDYLWRIVQGKGAGLGAGMKTAWDGR